MDFLDQIKNFILNESVQLSSSIFIIFFLIIIIAIFKIINKIVDLRIDELLNHIKFKYLTYKVKSKQKKYYHNNPELEQEILRILLERGIIKALFGEAVGKWEVINISERIELNDDDIKSLHKIAIGLKSDSEFYKAIMTVLCKKLKLTKRST